MTEIIMAVGSSLVNGKRKRGWRETMQERQPE